MGAGLEFPFRPSLEAGARLLVSITFASAGLFAALSYPAAPVAACLAFIVWTAYSVWRPLTSLTLTLALLPVVGFASWTGWLVVEELDLMLAGAAAAGYATAWISRHGSYPGGLPSGHGSLAGPQAPGFQRHRKRVPLALGPLAMLLLLLFGISSLIAMYRGVTSSDTTPFQWAQGYFDPLNSIRLFKPFAWVFILLPLLARKYRQHPEAFITSLTNGMVGGLGLCALAATWERAAFTGLLNFSTDYRSTALFWEMHVGGAALDGYLALGMPFAVWATLQAKQRVPFWLAGAAALLGAYACLTTFSRGVYLAVPVSLAVMALLSRRSFVPQNLAVTLSAILRTAIGLLGAAVGAWFVFENGGYRSALATLSVLAAIMISGPAARTIRVAASAAALATGMVLGLAIDLGWDLIPKGPYIFHAFATGLFVLGAMAHFAYPRKSTSWWMLGAVGWMAVTAARIAFHWGGMPAFVGAGPTLAVLLLLSLFNVALPSPLWSADRRAQTLLIGTVTLVFACVAVLGGGAYMGSRFSTSSQDMEGRIAHWTDGIGILNSQADWMFGKGLGRFPASYFYHLKQSELPGSYAWQREDNNDYLALSGPRYPMSWGDLFRISQRVPARAGNYRVSVDVRNVIDVNLHFEVCEKQLLYNAGCGAKAVAVKASPDHWSTVSLVLDGKDMSGGDWYAPRLALFSVAVGTSGAKVDLDNLQVEGPSGIPLMTNPGFTGGMSGWFFTSDRHHLPWHIKNLALNVLFDQGIFGLIGFALLVVAALGRLAFGIARQHPMSACLAASLVGFLCVGLFDSLLDVPRVSFVFYLLIAVALMLKPAQRSGTSSPPDVQGGSPHTRLAPTKY